MADSGDEAITLWPICGSANASPISNPVRLPAMRSFLHTDFDSHSFSPREDMKMVPWHLGCRHSPAGTRQ